MASAFQKQFSPARLPARSRFGEGRRQRRRAIAHERGVANGTRALYGEKDGKVLTVAINPNWLWYRLLNFKRLMKANSYRFFFDYIYYRITKTYFKWDGRTGGTAIVLITVMQVFFLFDVYVMLTRFAFDIRLMLRPYAQQIVYCAMAIFIVIFFLNYRKYNGSYSKMKAYWNDESAKHYIINGFLVLLALVFPFIFLILLEFM